jgi:hypothetical protein
MTYDVDDTSIEQLRIKRQRYSERTSSSQAVAPPIEMVIGDWHVDELGVRTRKITARE